MTDEPKSMATSLADLFGGKIPDEAINLFWTEPDDTTVAEMRVKLCAMAAALAAHGEPQWKSWLVTVHAKTYGTAKVKLALSARNAVEAERQARDLGLVKFSHMMEFDEPEIDGASLEYIVEELKPSAS